VPDSSAQSPLKGLQAPDFDVQKPARGVGGRAALGGLHGHGSLKAVGVGADPGHEHRRRCGCRARTGAIFVSNGTPCSQLYIFMTVSPGERTPAQDARRENRRQSVPAQRFALVLLLAIGLTARAVEVAYKAEITGVKDDDCGRHSRRCRAWSPRRSGRRRRWRPQAPAEDDLPRLKEALDLSRLLRRQRDYAIDPAPLPSA